MEARTDSPHFNLQEIKKEKCIGKGGFGIVYLCTDINNKKFVMKEIYIGHLSDADVVVSCKEAGILSSLKHPNVIEYMNHGVVENILYILMEYAPYGDLNDYITKMEPNPPEKKVISLFAQVVAGVVYIHDRAIVHRDICAKNILIGAGEVLKLSDFGISKRLESISSGGVAGNPVNFAPELCWGGKASQSSDIWALGCLLHHIATGEPPFSAPSLAGLVRTILRSPPVNLPAYSPLLGELLRSLLNKEPASRPTAEHLTAHPLLAIPILEAGLPKPIRVDDFKFFGLI